MSVAVISKFGTGTTAPCVTSTTAARSPAERHQLRDVFVLASPAANAVMQSYLGSTYLYHNCCTCIAGIVVPAPPKDRFHITARLRQALSNEGFNLNPARGDRSRNLGQDRRPEYSHRGSPSSKFLNNFTPKFHGIFPVIGSVAC